MPPDSFAPPLSPEAYARCFQTFKKISTEYQSTMRWVKQHLLGRLAAKPNFAVLSVGTGSGDFDFEFIKALQRKLKELEYVAEEPNPVFNRELRFWLAHHRFRRLDFEIEPEPFEKLAAARRFDLVHFTHVLYYIPDRERAILHAMDLISPAGLILIFHQTPMGINQIQRRFLAQVKGHTGEMLTSQDIQAVLDKLDIRYNLEISEGYLDVSECLRPQSPVGLDLLSFFLESDVRCLSPERQEEIIDYLAALSIPEKGRRLLFHPVAIFSLSPTR